MSNFYYRFDALPGIRPGERETDDDEAGRSASIVEFDDINGK